MGPAEGGHKICQVVSSLHWPALALHGFGACILLASQPNVVKSKQFSLIIAESSLQHAGREQQLDLQ